MRVNYNWYQGLSGMGDDGDYTATEFMQLDNGDTVDLNSGQAMRPDGTIYTYGMASSDGVPLPDQIVIPTGTNAEVTNRIVDAVRTNPVAQIVAPAGVSQSTVDNILRQLGAKAGAYIARQIGGKTLIVPQGGGFSTANVQQYIVPIAIIAGLYLLSKNG